MPFSARSGFLTPQLSPASNLWTPAALGATLGIWLDAQDSDSIIVDGAGRVSVWQDKSQNNNNSTQTTASNQPLYVTDGVNGLPSVYFQDSRLDAMLLPPDAPELNWTAGFTVFMVSNGTGIRLMQKGGNAGIGTTATEANSWAMATTTGLLANGAAMIYSNSFLDSVKSTSSYMICGQFTNDSSRTLANWFNGHLPDHVADVDNTWQLESQTATEVTITSGQTAPLYDTTTALTLGRRPWASSPAAMTGDVAEVIMIPGSITEDTRLKIEGYLAHKWVLADDLPIDHPYRNSAPINLDSLDTDTQSWISAVEANDGQALEPAVVTAMNDFVVGLKADGVWNQMYTIVPLAGPRTFNGTIIPLKGTAPTNVNFVSGDHSRSLGLVGATNGIGKYLISGHVMNEFTPSNMFVGAYITAERTPRDTSGNFNANESPIGRIETSTSTSSFYMLVLHEDETYPVTGPRLLYNRRYFNQTAQDSDYETTFTTGLVSLNSNTNTTNNLSVGDQPHDVQTALQGSPDGLALNIFTRRGTSETFSGAIGLYLVGEYVDHNTVRARCDSLMATLGTL